MPPCPALLNSLCNFLYPLSLTICFIHHVVKLLSFLHEFEWCCYWQPQKRKLVFSKLPTVERGELEHILSHLWESTCTQNHVLEPPQGQTSCLPDPPLTFQTSQDCMLMVWTVEAVQVYGSTLRTKINAPHQLPSAPCWGIGNRHQSLSLDSFVF